jgi:hypothetical protein
MALRRWALTNNGKHLAKQHKGFFGWRTLFFLDSAIRKEEEEMNKLLKKYEEHARKRAALQDEYDECKTAIKSSDTEVNDGGKPFAEVIGFTGWLKSFSTKPLYPEQKSSWKEVYDLMKGKGLFKSTVRKVAVVPQAVAVGQTVHQLTNPQQQSKKTRGQQQGNQQHHQ